MVSGNEDGKIFGIYSGTIIKRDDPEGISRVKVSVPGILEPSSDDFGPWAWPKGGGNNNWGKNDVPPLDTEVLVMFVNGDIETPVWEPAWHGKPIVGGEQTNEAFPEHEDPDVSVFGRGPFRLVIDNRDGQKTATFKIVRDVAGNEEAVAWVEFNYEDDSVEVFAEAALGLSSGAIVNIDAPVVQVRGRKVVPSPKAIN